MYAVKIGVLSAGAWSVAAHLPALMSRDDVEVVVVTSPDEHLAGRIKDEFGIPNSFASYEQALELGLDGVIVNSPPAFHRDMVLAALESGAHVLCEKPFALSIDDARAMADEARRKGLALLCGFGWVHMPLIAQAAEYIRNNELGDVEYVSVGLTVNARELLTEGKPYTSTVDAFAPSTSTYTDARISGGGAAAVSMTHAFAVLLAFAPSPVRSVFARAYLANNGLDLHDVVAIAFKEGQVGSVTCTSVHETRSNVGWRVEICGSRGSIVIDSDAGHWELARADGSVVSPDFEAGFGIYQSGGPTMALLAACRDNERHPLNNAEVAVQSAELMIATYNSIDTGTDVLLRDLRVGEVS